MGSIDFLPFLLHSTVIAHLVSFELYNFFYLDLPKHGAYQVFHVFAGRFNFLTIWNLTVQYAFFGICLLNDVFGSNTNPHSKLRRIRDFVHATSAFPLTLFVSITFWSIWAYDRNLVVPEELDAYFTPILNHSMHTFPLIYALLHTFICRTNYPSRTVGLTTLWIAACAYVSCVLAMYFTTGMWVYPILYEFSWGIRIPFMLALMMFVMLQYFVGEFINRAIWGNS